VIYGVGVYLCCLDERVCVHLGLFTLFLLSFACIFIYFFIKQCYTLTSLYLIFYVLDGL
jgi:hypothetical protein